MIPKRVGKAGGYRSGGTAGLRRQGVADRYGISPYTLDKMVERNEFPAPIHIGRIPFWPNAVIDEFEARKIATAKSV